MHNGASRLLFCLTLLLAACQPERQPPVQPVRTARPQASAARVDQASSERCRYAIRYPALPAEDAPLLRAMTNYAEQAKRQFLSACRAAPPASENAMAWELELEFRIRTVTPDFVSVLGEGSQYTGGAHGNPLLASFTLARRSGRVLDLLDLFSDPETALAALSQSAREALLDAARKARPNGTLAGDDQRWIRDGTQPRAENFTTFVVTPPLPAGERAAGLDLIFPAYQVAPYADGPQQVTLPARTFVSRLRPEFRDAFAGPSAH